MKKFLIIIIIVLALTGLGFWYYYSISNKNIPQENVVQNYNSPISETSLSTSTTENAQSQTFSINIQNFSFNPQEIKVKIGDKIIWTNQDSVNHIVESDKSGLFASNPLGSGQTFEWVANVKGEISYHCKIHPSMKGKIIVE